MKRKSSTTTLAALLAAGALTLTACGGGSGFDDESADADAGAGAGAGNAELTVLIGSSGDSETDAVTTAVSDWSTESGTAASVNVASDLVQQLSQGFAGGNPPDVFYLGSETFAGYAANGSLLPYAAELSNADDFFPTLSETFTFDGTFTCAPKDFSTLALIINTDAWATAGLTDADIPTTWDQLRSTATALTTDTQVGLTFGPEYQRIGAFFEQAGGSMTSEDGTEAAVNSAENVEALTYVKSLLTEGVLKYPADIDSGWGGEAFGTGKAAMTIEGNWIDGAMKTDYPDVSYTVVELPAGPAGKGTLQFTNCWGIAADGANTGAATALVEHLTAPETQLAFADAFGVMPSVQSAAADWTAKYPEKAAFLDSAEFAVGVVNAQGATDVIADFNAQLEALASSDPQAILDSVQTNLEAVLGASS
ncbi:sugar ABC transporter substrate-binding protein [Pengzhenrongella sicca]|uniref:Extracellular solute-binding protein n=1 Tax=Pengzhenrongella sicca TaxID=2819238 RepID=A0A8A4Z8X1_9MICO|nr:extracellular solute-binding protein [Pengzhenrongella sicca]QTE28322.1 extracellular solute-binding protein [Pengzhenrongella sicca]